MKDFLFAEPHTPTRTACIFLPGISGNALSEELLPLTAMLNDANIASLRLQPWAGKAEFDTLTLDDMQRAITEAVAFLHSNKYTHILGTGKSFGGAMLLYARPSPFDALVLWAPATQLAAASTLQTLHDTPFGTMESVFHLHPNAAEVADTPRTLIIRGQEDELVSEKTMDDLVTAMPDAALLTIPHMTHSAATPDEAFALYAATVAYLKEA